MNYQNNIYKQQNRQIKKTKYNPLFINFKIILITISIISLFFWMKSLYNSITELSINNEIMSNDLQEKNKLIIQLKKQNKKYISIIKQKEKNKKETIIPKKIKKQIKDTAKIEMSIIKDTL